VCSPQELRQPRRCTDRRQAGVVVVGRRWRQRMVVRPYRNCQHGSGLGETPPVSGSASRLPSPGANQVAPTAENRISALSHARVHFRFTYRDIKSNGRRNLGAA
jgi:hypothetical protein